MRLGIMGGTFDPIHLGHLSMAETAREIFQLKEILFIPSASPPHKADRQIASKVHRLMMTYLATESNENFLVSPMEMMRDGFSYTLDTVNELHKKYGNQTELFFIIGSDSMADLSHWHKAQELVGKAYFLSAARPGVELNFDSVRKVFGMEGLQFLLQIFEKESNWAGR